MNPNGRWINEKALFCNCYTLDSEKGVANLLIKLKLGKIYLSAVILSW